LARHELSRSKGSQEFFQAEHLRVVAGSCRNRFQLRHAGFTHQQFHLRVKVRKFTRGWSLLHVCPGHNRDLADMGTHRELVRPLSHPPGVLKYLSGFRFFQSRGDQQGRIKEYLAIFIQRFLSGVGR
jgi:hypothetical protein